VTLVLDSSIALAWHFEDEQTEAVRGVLAEVAEAGAVVPGLWRFEVANGLQMALRRGRIDAVLRDRALANLAALNVQIDDGCDVQVWSATVRLADLYRLPVYDVAYLELAQRTRLPLATLDVVLAAGARAAGVAVRP
jgi:predicted nucleic acid-binding protein